MARRDKESKAWAQVLDELEGFIQQVKNEYEMYFMGIQKRPPTQKELELKRTFHELTQNPPTNTQLVFKLRVLRTRYNTLALRWLRTSKEIEEGRYKGQRFMADKREEERLAQRRNRKTPDEIRAEIRALARGEELPEPEPAAAPTSDSTLRETPGERVAARRGETERLQNRPDPGYSADSDALLVAYMGTRKRNGESLEIDRQKLQATLRKHASAIKEKYGVADVRFRVVSEDGKAKLKAIPVKK